MVATNILLVIMIFCSVGAGYLLGKCDRDIPVMQEPAEPIKPAVRCDYYIDKLTGDRMKQSFSTYPEKMADGTEREIIIRNN